LLYILSVTAMKQCSPLDGYQRFGGEYCLLVRHVTPQQLRPSRSHNPLSRKGYVKAIVNILRSYFNSKEFEC